ncbi:hypothetical protein L207DRAFT_590683 [Hyaloscypha variabilis F]|uniref:GPI-anchored cell wall organization protein Ecm33 n=1 Tax=Hyaloscypha variabilis (strain UAMH 11265 / GT02V1 / F) TaxID=1149755 RepID=A0A2J6R1J8_HYAVF|nr:hypothetical protein L207DRAFT_590683 [Hyaloscypha variabilis F]
MAIVTTLLYFLAFWGSSTSLHALATRYGESDVDEQDSFLFEHKRQSSSACSGNITILHQAGLATSQIASCTSFTGDIILDHASGNISFLTEAEEGLTFLDGSVYCRNNAGLQQLSLFGLITITGSVVVDNVENLVLMEGEALVNVQSIRVTDAPKMLFVSFAALNQLEFLEIGGTPMTYEDTISSGLAMASIGSLYIHDNFNLTIGVLSFLRLRNITNSFIFENNGPNSQIVMNLLWASNITLRNVQSIDFQRMIAVNNSFEISNSENLTDIGSDVLGFIGGSFVQNNPNLQRVGLAGLKSTGGSLVITENPSLQFLAAGSLQTVTSMDLAGPFQSLNSLNVSFDSLSHVSEGIKVEFTNQTPPVECTWSVGDETHALSGAWSSFFVCNGTVHTPSTHTSNALLTQVKPGGIASCILLAVACWSLFYWTVKL